MEGVPGVAKTLLVRTLAGALDVETRRVQFTPDLMPGDITGLDGDRGPGGRAGLPRRARCSPSCCWPTRSTGRHPRPSRRCWRRWRRGRSPWTASPGRCRAPSWSPRPRTPSSTKAPIPCPRRSSTGSCSRSSCPSPGATHELEILTRHADGFDPRDVRAAGVRAVAGPADIEAGQARGPIRAGLPRGDRLHRRHRACDPRLPVALARRLAAWRHRPHALGPRLGLAATAATSSPPTT